MKLIIPTNDKDGLNAKVAIHFGRCNTYTIIDENGSLVEVIDNTSEHNGGKGLPPELMKEHNANILLCKGLGRRALNLCQEFDIKVFVDDSETVKDIFDAWKNGKLKEATVNDACDH